MNVYIWRRIGNNLNEIQWLRDQINLIKSLSKVTVHFFPLSFLQSLVARNWVPPLVVTSFKFISQLKSLLMTCVCVFVCNYYNVSFWYIWIMCFSLQFHLHTGIKWSQSRRQSWFNWRKSSKHMSLSHIHMQSSITKIEKHKHWDIERREKKCAKQKWAAINE